MPYGTQAGQSPADNRKENELKQNENKIPEPDKNESGNRQDNIVDKEETDQAEPDAGGGILPVD